jgi:hypothetical protein
MKKNALIVLLVFSGLVSGVFLFNKKTPEPVEPDSVLQYADSVAEGILQSFNSGSYSEFSKNFSETMKGSVPESGFMENRNLIRSEIGEYVSKEFWKSGQEGLYYNVYYKADFNNEEEKVSVLIIFEEISGEMKVSGLWFDSPKLRE